MPAVTKGILGRKLGMTQIFDETARAIPVTVIEAGPCPVVVIVDDAVAIDGDDYVRRALDEPLNVFLSSGSIFFRCLLLNSSSARCEVGISESRLRR